LQPVRRLFADRAHPVLELEASRLAQSVHFARERTFELLELAPLDLGKRDLEPRPRLALRRVDLLGERVLALSQPFRDLLDRPAPVGRLALELVDRLGERLLRGLLELLAQADRRRPLLVDGGPELARPCFDPGSHVDDALSLTLLERGHLPFG